MEDALAVTILGLKSMADILVKKLISTVCNIPKLMLEILFGIQVKIIWLTFGYLVRMCKVAQNTVLFKYIFPENVSSREPVIDQKAVVKGAKKLRRTILLNIKQYYGLDVKSDMDLIQERLDEVHRCMDGDDDDKTFEALAKLKELNKPFEDGSWKDKYIKDLEVCEYADDEIEKEGKPTTNVLEEPECDIVTSNVYNEQEDLNSNEVKRDKRDIQGHLQTPARNDLEKGPLKDSLTKDSSFNQAKLEEVLNLSSSLVEELTRLNSYVHRLSAMDEKMAKLQSELGEGKKLLSEIEEDRSEMRRKLSVLESMIKEEEQYLDDVSGESGYDESETSNP